MDEKVAGQLVELVGQHHPGNPVGGAFAGQGGVEHRGHHQITEAFGLFGRDTVHQIADDQLSFVQELSKTQAGLLACQDGGQGVIDQPLVQDVHG